MRVCGPISHFCLNEYQTNYVETNPGTTLRHRTVDDQLEYRFPGIDGRLIYRVEQGICVLCAVCCVLCAVCEGGNTYWRVSFEAGHKTPVPAVSDSATVGY